MRDPVCAIDLFTISDAVLHAKTYSNVLKSREFDAR